MIYRVMYDGVNIYDVGADMTLLSTSVQIELNSAGSFEFTMPPAHQYYDTPKVLESDVEVYEEDKVIWYGRPIEISTDFLNRKKVYCEGALAFFNDSIQRPAEYENILVKDFFSTIISNHNSQVPASRRFVVGNITIQNKNKSVYRKLDYETTFDAIKKMCIEAEGGYLFVRRVSGVTYIDWVSSVPLVNNQSVKYALNLIDLTKHINGGEIITAVIPLGPEDENGVKMTVTDINGGKDYIAVAEASTYGLITSVVDFSDATDKYDLLAKGKQWLLDEQFDHLSVEVNAADLHYIDSTYPDFFQVGQMIHCYSKPHSLDKSFPIVKMTLSLDTAVKKITIGTPNRVKLTEIYKKDGTQSSSSYKYKDKTEEAIPWDEYPWDEYNSGNTDTTSDGG